MAESEVRSFMIANMICIAEDIELDEDDYTAQMTEDATTYGYASFEDFEEQAGEEAFPRRKWAVAAHAPRVSPPGREY